MCIGDTKWWVNYIYLFTKKAASQSDAIAERGVFFFLVVFIKHTWNTTKTIFLITTIRTGIKKALYLKQLECKQHFLSKTTGTLKALVKKKTIFFKLEHSKPVCGFAFFSCFFLDNFEFIYWNAELGRIQSPIILHRPNTIRRKILDANIFECRICCQQIYKREQPNPFILSTDQSLRAF